MLSILSYTGTFSSVTQSLYFFWAIQALFSSVAQYHSFYGGITNRFLLLIPPLGGISDTFSLPIPQNFFFGGITGHFLLLIPPLGGISNTFSLPIPQSVLKNHSCSLHTPVLAKFFSKWDVHPA